MLSRAREAFFNAKPLLYSVGSTVVFVVGAIYFDHRVDQAEKVKVEKENPGRPVEKIRLPQGHYGMFGRYSFYKWAVIDKKPIEPAPALKA